METVNTNQKTENENRDALTGFLNLYGALSQLQLHANDAAGGFSVIVYLNVMNFKLFNQQYGFAGGNEYLKALASEIQNIFSDDVIARTGGDQFIILSKNLEHDEIINKLDKLGQEAHKHDKALVMRIKAGIYLSQGDEQDPVIMIDRAKIACDDIIKVYDKDYNFYDDDLKKKNDLKQYVIDNFENAFKQHYFKVFYQKEVRALTGKVCGYEALARWIDPVYGMISPAIFVEVLEEVHLINKLDIFMINQVCQELRQDMDYGMAVVPVSVNLSRLDFELCDIKAEINKCREKYNIPVDLLNIEITESAVAEGEDFLAQHIQNFRNDGYQVWMDDFGAGYSSLNNLKIYDFDVLKIDMNFLRSFETNKRSRVILATIVNMAKELGMHTLAEGVETQEQYEFLRDIGCEKLQGYLFGKPKPIEDFVKPDEFTFDNCEDVSFKDYYTEIGNINFLGTTPLKEKNMEVFNNIPIAILELSGEERVGKALYANDAYREFLSSIGVRNVDEMDARSYNHELPEVKQFETGAIEAEKSSDHCAMFDRVINGHVINTQIRFLSRHEDKAAYAVISRNMTISEKDGRLSENIQVAMAHVFNQYFRVDLYDQDGTVENIFLNGDQIPVAETRMDAKKAVEQYSNIYLYPQERERFRKFYDISTVKERLSQAGTAYLVDYYHSAIPGDRGRMQMYMLLPFYYNDRWKYISCCRYADEITYQFSGGNQNKK